MNPSGNCSEWRGNFNKYHSTIFHYLICLLFCNFRSSIPTDSGDDHPVIQERRKRMEGINCVNMMEDGKLMEIVSW